MDNLISKLKNFRDEDILHDIDLEFMLFLKDQHPNISNEVLLAGCLCSYLYRQGDVCLPIKEYAGQLLFNEQETEIELRTPGYKAFRKALEESSAVGMPGEFKPLIFDSPGRLYLHKLWHYEQTLAEQLITRGQQGAEEVDPEILKDGLNRLFGESNDKVDWQQVAAACSVRNHLSIISGGPGTGKTSTIVRIIVLLLEQYEKEGSQPSIALTAPTGKAAARLQEAVTEARETLDVSPAIRDAIPDTAVTMHQLLGARRHTKTFKHHADNPLQHDIVIVDEVSMVDQAMMSKLLAALRDGTRLILLGDKDQLASVEAGSVLGDICMYAQNQFSSEAQQWLGRVGVGLPEDAIDGSPRALTDNITLLTKSYRFDEQSGIGRLARYVNDGKAARSLQILADPLEDELSFQEISDASALKQLLQQKVGQYYQQLQHSRSPAEAFELLEQFRILAAHRKGPWGVRFINRLVERMLRKTHREQVSQMWYAGKPIIVNTNDYSLGLYNGDIGLCLPNERGELRIYFKTEDGFKEVLPGRLPDHSRAYALTIHKSQGSEFDRLLLVLPARPSRVVSRELIYTAITRARTAVEVAGTKKTFRAGVETKLQRVSGLAERLWEI